MAKATKQPTGLTATRKGNSFTFSWKIADKDYYAGIRIWASNRKRVLVNKAIDGRSTSYTLTYNIKEAASGLTFSVKGQRRKDDDYTYSMSAYTTKRWEFALPLAPKASFTLDNDHINSGTFSWTINAPDTWWAACSGWEYESILIKNCNDSDPTHIQSSLWANAVKGHGDGTSGNWTKTEDSSLFNVPGYSYTRWLRVRSVGPKGKSSWSYAHHTYALPGEATNITASISAKGQANGYMCTVKWSAAWRFMRPIQRSTVEYAIAKPVTTSSIIDGKRVISWDCPENPSWKDAGSVLGASDKNAITFSIDDFIDADNVAFVRVLTHYDTSLPSREIFASGGELFLPDPTNIQISTMEPSTRKITVSADNPSELSESYLRVLLLNDKDNRDAYQILGIITKNDSNVIVTIPEGYDEDDIVIGVQTYLADYNIRESGGEILPAEDLVFENIKMASKNIIWSGSNVQSPPDIQLIPVNSEIAQVIWSWKGLDVDQIELSWADHNDAWESTSEPSSYIVNNTHNGQWNISGLGVGTWYIRARFIRVYGENVTYGPWSDIKSIKLSSAPAIPSLILSPETITPDGEVTAYWAYVSTDGTSQMQADICEATLNDETGEFTYGPSIARSETAQHVSILASDHGWSSGEKHYLAVRVISASGEQSNGWSTPVPLSIADAINAEITSTSLEEVEFVRGEETISELSLTRMPLDITVSGVGTDGKTTIAIERSEYYVLDRPDEETNNGFEGETIYVNTFDGDGEFHINQADLIGNLDDGAPYRLVVSVKDSYGQAFNIDPIEFHVHWENQAIAPIGTYTINHEYDVAILSPEVPSGTTIAEGDVCDIYRLSIDKPKLIYQGAAFGTQYVDPYPTLGENCGYRFVYRTANGDYITNAGTMAWNDARGENIDTFGVMINYGEDRITLPYNVSLNNKWAKDFQKTSYLGGSIQGDWNPTVERTGSISTVAIVNKEFGSQSDIEMVEAIRRLATYPGVCHIRTPDGSSFAGNINVTEDRDEKMINNLAKFSLEITKVDEESLDGLTYDEWIADIGDE